MKVHDGLSVDDPLIGRYCGNQLPSPIRSTSNVLYVRFVADYTIHGTGFNATYQQEDGKKGFLFTFKFVVTWTQDGITIRV